MTTVCWKCPGSERIARGSLETLGDEERRDEVIRARGSSRRRVGEGPPCGEAGGVVRYGNTTSAYWAASATSTLRSTQRREPSRSRSSGPHALDARARGRARDPSAVVVPARRPMSARATWVARERPRRRCADEDDVGARAARHVGRRSARAATVS